MTGETEWTDPRATALAHLTAYRNLPDKAAKHTWAMVRALARSLRSAPPQFVLQVARELFTADGWKGHAWMLLNLHKGAFALLDEAEVEAFGQGIAHWGSVDGYARLVAGPAWLRGQIPDATVHRWARSEDRWIVGPSAIGSENGTPSSIISAPPRTNSCIKGTVIEGSESPAVINGINAFLFCIFSVEKVVAIRFIRVVVM